MYYGNYSIKIIITVISPEEFSNNGDLYWISFKFIFSQEDTAIQRDSGTCPGLSSTYWQSSCVYITDFWYLVQSAFCHVTLSLSQRNTPISGFLKKSMYLPRNLKRNISVQSVGNLISFGTLCFINFLITRNLSFTSTY